MFILFIFIFNFAQITISDGAKFCESFLHCLKKKRNSANNEHGHPGQAHGYVYTKIV